MKISDLCSPLYETARGRAMWQQGLDDYVANRAPDWDYLDSLPQQDRTFYINGYKHKQTVTPKKRGIPIKQIRASLPAKLAAISDKDLKAAYQMLRNGHSLDNVQTIEPRDDEEAFDDLVDTLQELARHVQDGVIGLYRTIAVEDPESFVSSLTKPTRLGIYWSLSEHYTMSHEDEQRVLFSVDAPIESINWPETIVLTIDGVEGEVRLKEKHSVRLNYTEPDAINQSETHFA